MLDGDLNKTMDESSPNYGKIMTYIENHPAAVVGTISDDGTPHGAVVYVCVASHHTVFFVTKNQTQKYKNLLERPQLSLTFFNDSDSSTLQAQGKAFVADNPKMIDYAMQKMAKIHAMQAEWLPPIAKLRAGNYAVIGVELTSARLAEYQGMGIGSDSIFTEL